MRLDVHMYKDGDVPLCLVSKPSRIEDCFPDFQDALTAHKPGSSVRIHRNTWFE